MMSTILRYVHRLRRLRLPVVGALDASVGSAVAIAAVVGLVFLVWLINGPSIIVNNGPAGDRIVSATSPLTGRPCADPTRRPVAVMLASDEEARPLSGLSAADMVFEMPVTPSGITRMMAIFQCGEPAEVGSIRSARMDFIPIVQGLHAIYAHWGGERDALAKLDGNATDNVDALKYEGTVYYRKNNVARPHNGFTTLAAVREKAADLGYAASVSLDPYPRTTDAPERNLAALTTEVAQGNVVFRYDPETNLYGRERGKRAEIDRTTNEQVRVSVVAILDTTAAPTHDDYLAVQTVGQGSAAIYQNGRRIEAVWKKPATDAMLTFTDAGGRPLSLVPGPLWVMYAPNL